MIFLSALALLYFLPTVVAANRGHQIAGVLLLNLFFGWTVVGWFALLFWALLSYPRYLLVPIHSVYNHGQYGQYGQR